MTCGSGGSPTSACPGRTGRRAANTCSSAPGTTARYRKWFPRRAFPDVTGRRVRPPVHGRQRPRTRSQDHQGRVADLPLLPRNRGHPGRGVPGRQGTARAARAAARNDIPQGLGIVVQHGPTERLHLLGHHQRTGATRTSRRRRPAHPGTAGLGRRITKGKPFAPDDPLRGILEDAVAVGNATARTVSFAPREEGGFTYHEDSNWFNMLFVGGYEFLDPPPQITPNGVVPSRSDWARKLNRTRRSSTPTPGSRPRRACSSPGWGRST